MKLNRSTLKAKRKGFTLIELLVSMTVTMVIIGVLMAMTRVAVDGMQSATNATRYSRISQEVMSTVSKDLEGIVIRTGNPYEWVSVKKITSNKALGPKKGYKQMQNPIEFSFFSAVTDRYDGKIGTKDDDGGDISYVRYKLEYQDVITGNENSKFKVFSLYRRRIEPKEAFNSYLALDEAKGGIIPDFGEVGGADFLAENIYDITISFNFEFLKANGTTIYKRIPVQVNNSGGTTSLKIKGDGLYLNGSTTPYIEPGAGSARLSSADISLFVLSDAGMKGLDKVKIDNEEELSAYLTKHGKNFSKSVILPRP